MAPTADAHAARRGAVSRWARELPRDRAPAAPGAADRRREPALARRRRATCNRLGATLADLRAAFEDAVRERIAGGDERLVLAPGLPLLPAERFCDGIHPDDEGHARLAAALGR